MKKLLFALLMLPVLSVLAEAPVDPSLRIERLSGKAALSRPSGQAWPLEEGQRVLEGDRLQLQEGSSAWFRYLKRVRLRVDGPAVLTIEKLEEPAEDGSRVPSLQAAVEGGWVGLDTRYQFERSMHLGLRSHGRLFKPGPGQRWLVGNDEKGRPVYASMPQGRLVAAEISGETLVERKKQKEKYLKPVPRDLRRWLDRSQPILVLARDFDRDSGRWPNPSVLGPVLVRELGSSFPRQLTMVDGSGNTYFSRMANHAIKTADDTWLRTLGLKMGARWILVGNLVVRDPDLDPGAATTHQPQEYRARAEARLIESHPGGDILVSDVANTTVARVGRPRAQSQRLALEGAASVLAQRLKYHFKGLFEGRTRSESLASFSFNNVHADVLPRLKKSLADLEEVQRLFSRRFSNGVYKVDLVPRYTAARLLDRVSRLELEAYRLEAGGRDGAGAVVYTLRER